jgi:hypothetical protein
MGSGKSWADGASGIIFQQPFGGLTLDRESHGHTYIGPS